MNRGNYASKEAANDNETISADINKKTKFSVKIVTEL